MFIMMHLFGHEPQEWLIQQDESEQCVNGTMPDESMFLPWPFQIVQRQSGC